MPNPTAAGGSTGSNTTTINKPASTASGDLLVMFMASGAASTFPTAPAGWNDIDTVNAPANGGGGVNVRCKASYLVAGASEPASYTWTAGTGSTFNAGCIVRVTGQNSTTAIDAHGTATSTTTTVSVSALTASVANDLLIIFSNDFWDLGVSSWADSATTLSSASDLAGGDFQTGTVGSLASGSTGTLSTTYNSGTAALANIAILVKAPSGGGNTFNQSVSDSHSGRDVFLKGPQKNLPPDTQSATDLKTLLTGKNVPGDFFSETDTKTLGTGKNLTDAHSAQDTRLPFAVVKNLTDTASLLDSVAKTLVRTLSDKFSETDSVSTIHFTGQLWNRLVTDAHSALDSLTRQTTKLATDAFSETDSWTHAWVAHLLITEFVSLVDIFLKGVTRTTTDATSGQDSRQLQSSKNLLDNLSGQDSLTWGMQKNLADTTVGVDVPIKQVTRGVFDSFSETDRITIARGVLITVLDALSLTDQVVKLQDLRPGTRFPLVVTASLVASAFGITVSFANSPLAVAPSLLPGSLTVTPALEAD